MDYSALGHDAQKQDQAKERVTKRAIAITAATMRVVSDIATSASVSAFDKQPPRYVQAMLADVKKRFGHIENVRQSIDRITTGERQPIKDLLDLRNHSAHASADGIPREVDKDELRVMLETMNHVLCELSNCGVAILQKQPSEK